MPFLNILGVAGVLCSPMVVVEEKPGRELLELSK